jgi:AraC family transcriptional activator of pobA
LTATVTIPTYDLYGRPAGWSGPEPLFCESLERSNRIYMRDSRIPTHRHLNLFQFFCFTGRSGIVIELDGEHHRVRPPAALLVAPLSVHGFTFASDSGGYILTCPESALGEFLVIGGADAEHLSRSALIASGGGVDFERLAGDFALLLDEFGADQPARIQGLRARALPIVLWFMRTLIRASGPPASNGEDRGADLVTRFLGLVNRHYREQRPLSFYADELGVSSTHLNRLTRQRIGKTASATICERVLLEAQRELAYTNRRVSAIAYAMGYRDPAYFTRLFTRKVGLTPSAYRRRMESL